MNSNLDHLMFSTRAIGFLVKHALTSEIALDYQKFFEIVYRRVEGSPEAKRDAWNSITWAIYTTFPIASEVNESKLNAATISWVCQKAASLSGSKVEKSNMVTKAADEVILACINQFGLRYVVEQTEGCEAVENTITGRLKKTSSTPKSTTPVNYQNIDSTVFTV